MVELKKIISLVLIAITSACVFAGCAKSEDKKVENNYSKVDDKNFSYSVDPETFSIKVNVDGSTYSASNPLEKTEVENYKKDGDKISWSYPKKNIDVALEKKDNYLDVKIKSNTKKENSFTFPKVSGDSYMLPIGEGKNIPKDDKTFKDYFKENELNTLENFSMQFFAVNKDKYSLLYIIENPYNNKLIASTKGDLNFDFNHEYPTINEDKEYGFRIYVTDKNPVSVAKTYKNYIIEKGEFKTLSEKAEKNKNIEKLYGAPFVYFWDKNVISKENIVWSKLNKDMPKELKDWIKNLLKTKVPDSSDVSSAFDELGKSDYVNKYTKNRIVTGISDVLMLKEFYNKDIFKNLDDQSKTYLEKGIDKLNPVEIVDLNKRLLKGELGDCVDPVDKWNNSNTVDVIDDMKKSGINNMWIGFDDWQTGFDNPNFVKEANYLGYLVGTYDSYHSIHKPGEEEWNTAKFSDKTLYDNATVTDKNGKKIEGFQGTGRKLNPTLAMPSVKERVSSIMNTGLLFNSWFLDTDATGEVYDDYSKNHITTQKQDIKARLQRMEYLENDWNMVVGSEGGNDFASKTLAFAHGIDTPSFNWMDPDMKSNKESKYYFGKYYSNTGGVPELFKKPVPLKDKYRTLFLDEKYTIPLYKLVYNDSVITTYWWGNGTLKFKDDVKNRMLSEILFNVPPLYHIDKNEWESNKDTIVNHTKVWSDFSKKVINKEMTNYKVLTDNREVQMTEYGNDIKVIANFSNKDVNVSGDSIKAKSLLIIDGNNKTIYTP
ncbi:MAG: glycoside hydrolase [Clostridium chrysemydis]|uniref:glycoside hydrolase n=1 Tax=Clostridium chrysemydis TaxID=2665504 RepID=UPI003F413044